MPECTEERATEDKVEGREEGVVDRVMEEVIILHRGAGGTISMALSSPRALVAPRRPPVIDDRHIAD